MTGFPADASQAVKSRFNCLNGSRQRKQTKTKTVAECNLRDGQRPGNQVTMMKPRNQAGNGDSKKGAVKQGQIVSAKVRRRIEDQGKVETAILVCLRLADGLSLAHVPLRAAAFHTAYCEPDQRVFSAALAWLKAEGKVIGTSAKGWMLTDAGRKEIVPSMAPKDTAALIADAKVKIGNLEQCVYRADGLLRLLARELTDASVTHHFLPINKAMATSLGFLAEDVGDCLAEQMTCASQAVMGLNGVVSEPRYPTPSDFAKAVIGLNGVVSERAV